MKVCDSCALWLIPVHPYVHPPCNPTAGACHHPLSICRHVQDHKNSVHFYVPLISLQKHGFHYDDTDLEWEGCMEQARQKQTAWTNTYSLWYPILL